MKKFRICALALLMLLAGTNVFVANRNNEIKKSLDIENVEALGWNLLMNFEASPTNDVVSTAYSLILKYTKIESYDSNGIAHGYDCACYECFSCYVTLSSQCNIGDRQTYFNHF
ncbi:MAG: hypothetical protein MJ211_06295 [Bacteroidales bacterium]|nr:hypothetical protein [Bacteroidales bacterium]